MVRILSVPEEGCQPRGQGISTRRSGSRDVDELRRYFSDAITISWRKLHALVEDDREILERETVCQRDGPAQRLDRGRSRRLFRDHSARSGLLGGRRAADGSPDQGRGSSRPIAGGLNTRERSCVPRSRAEGYGDLQVGTRINEPELLRTEEVAANPEPPRGDDLLLVSAAKFSGCVVLEHCADQRHPPGARDTVLEVLELSYEVLVGIV